MKASSPAVTQTPADVPTRGIRGSYARAELGKRCAAEVSAGHWNNVCQLAERSLKAHNTSALGVCVVTQYQVVAVPCEAAGNAKANAPGSCVSLQNLTSRKARDVMLWSC